MSSIYAPTDLKQLKEWGTTEWTTFLRREEDMLMRTSGKIALIGPPGAGKSRTVNSLREVKASDSDAAPVSSYASTVEIRVYSHRKNRLVTFWDLPGVGTPGYEKEIYLDKINIDQYDFFLLLSAGKFTDVDIWLAKEIANRKKPYYFVRTKVSFDLANELKMKEECGKICSEDDVLNDIRAYVQSGLKELNKSGENVEVFLIENDEFDKYDFRKLMEKLTDAFPSIQSAALIRSLHASSSTMIRDKVKELRSQVWKHAQANAIAGSIPIPVLGFAVSFTYDINARLHMLKWYRNQLGLDETSLIKISQITGTDMKVLQGFVDTVTSCFVGSIVIIVIRKKAAKKAIGDLVKFGIPIVGSVAVGGLIYVENWLVLNKMLDKLEDAAIKVMETALQKRHPQSTASSTTLSPSQPPPARISSSAM